MRKSIAYICACALLGAAASCAAVDATTGTTLEQRCLGYRTFVEAYCPMPELQPEE